MKLAAVVVLALIAPVRAAQPTGDLSWIIELLDSPDWAVREAFTNKLEHDWQIGLREIESLMRSEEVSLEVRLRLANVAKTRFFQTNRAAVGMGPMNDGARFGVTVARLAGGIRRGARAAARGPHRRGAGPPGS